MKIDQKENLCNTMITDFMVSKGYKPSARQKRINEKRVRITAQKYASLQTEFSQQVKRFKSTGKHVSRSLISKLETARSNYEKAQKRSKAVGSW